MSSLALPRHSHCHDAAATPRSTATPGITSAVADAAHAAVRCSRRLRHRQHVSQRQQRQLENFRVLPRRPSAATLCLGDANVGRGEEQEVGGVLVHHRAMYMRQASRGFRADQVPGFL